MTRRVLVAGGTGFIGGAVARALRGRGDDVVVLGRGSRPAPAGCELRLADRADRTAMALALEAQSFDVTLDFSAYDREAIEGMLQVQGFEPGRIIVASTGQVCLVGTSLRLPYTEPDGSTPLRPEPVPGTRDHRNWTYGTGKRGVEAAIAEARLNRGSDALIVRLPVILGAGDTSLRTWGYLERILDGGPLLLPGSGDQPVRFLWVEDVIRAVIRILDRWPLPSPVYHLAQPDIISLRHAIEQFASCAGRALDWVAVDEPALAGAGLDGNVSPYSGRWVSVLDPGLAAREWGFEATSFEHYVGEVVRAHIDHPPAVSDMGYESRACEIALARALKSSAP